MSTIETIRVELRKYDYVRFSFSDLKGTKRGITVPGRKADKCLENGLDLFQGLLLLDDQSEMKNIIHKKSYNLGNMTIVCDCSTFHAIPWAGEGVYKVAEILCECKWKIDMSPQEACPRYLARRQLALLDDMGLRLLSGFEVEHYLLQAETLEPIFKEKAYMCQRTMNKFSKIIFDFESKLHLSGVDIGKIHVESEPGLFEMVTAPKYGIEAADSCCNLKEGLHEMAAQKGLKATFITSPFIDLPDPAMDYNFSIWSRKTGENVFYDVDSNDKLSKFAKHWIAGLITHSRALTALCCPSINCYRRFHQTWSPELITWGIEDRSGAFRVKNHGPDCTYIENRIPSGLCNPYLVIAGTIAAGLDGVKKELTCVGPGVHPHAETLPDSLVEALSSLQEDVDMVAALGEEFVEWLRASKSLDLKRPKSISNDMVFKS